MEVSGLDKPPIIPLRGYLAHVPEENKIANFIRRIHYNTRQVIKRREPNFSPQEPSHVIRKSNKCHNKNELINWPRGIHYKSMLQEKTAKTNTTKPNKE